MDIINSIQKFNTFKIFNFIDFNQWFYSIVLIFIFVIVDFLQEKVNLIIDICKSRNNWLDIY